MLPCCLHAQGVEAQQATATRVWVEGTAGAVGARLDGVKSRALVAPYSAALCGTEREQRPINRLEIHLPHPGSIMSLILRPSPLHRLLEPRAVLDVAMTALNFRDVLNVLGLDPTGLVRPLGGESAGVASATGSLPCRSGGRVFGLTPGSLRARALFDSLYMSRAPCNVTFESAVTLPVAWVTVRYCVTQAHLRSMQCHVVHAAAGGVGLASCEWALRVRALARGTAGAQVKHASLASHGLTQTASSRVPTAFAIHLALHLHQQRLHSLTNALSNDFVPVSLAVVSAGGTVVEIGKNNIWSPERISSMSAGCSQTLPTLQFVAVGVDDGCSSCPGWNRDRRWFSAPHVRKGRAELVFVPASLSISFAVSVLVASHVNIAVTVCISVSVPVSTLISVAPLSTRICPSPRLPCGRRLRRTRRTRRTRRLRPLQPHSPSSFTSASVSVVSGSTFA